MGHSRMRNYWEAALQCEMIDAGPSAVCTETYLSLDGALEAFAPIFFCGGGDAGATSSDGSTPESGATDASSD